MKLCCSACRRGMPGMGGGCGQPACKCHWLEQNDPTERLSAPPSTEYTFSNPDRSERRTQ